MGEQGPTPEEQAAHDRQRSFEAALLVVLERTAYTNIHLHFPTFMPEDVEQMIDTLTHAVLTRRVMLGGRMLPVSLN